MKPNKCPVFKRCKTEKAAWCARELGVKTNHVDMTGQKKQHAHVKGRKEKDIVNVITCWSRNKHCESFRKQGKQAVLIDDREELAAKWNGAGGLFIHHTDTTSTIKMLKEHGILVKSLSSTRTTNPVSSTGSSASSGQHDKSIKTQSEEMNSSLEENDVPYDLPPDTP
mmetsp:Transcript_20124/g.27954  ORF Transcript_20124/g.27954 Transcript_20124/m.27954 type:complete len:168 (-) Transcript_20124:546-1049(-)